MRICLPVCLLVGLLMLFGAGCTPIRPMTPSATPPTPIPFTPAASQSITQENTITMPMPSDNPQVVQAMKALSAQLGTPLDQITVVSAEPVVWPDGALGCPQPGMVYPQVQQDGMRIVLAVDGQEYHFHSGETRGPFLCENPAGG
ncbi:MAG TPA: hypothetical protein PKE45_10995 [Caldilineaceae bacterium]|nr:hypothetical protein [Caldilineaceae bacterium]